MAPKCLADIYVNHRPLAFSVLSGLGISHSGSQQSRLSSAQLSGKSGQRAQSHKVRAHQKYSTLRGYPHFGLPLLADSTSRLQGDLPLHLIQFQSLAQHLGHGDWGGFRAAAEPITPSSHLKALRSEKLCSPTPPRDPVP